MIQWGQTYINDTSVHTGRFTIDYTKIPTIIINPVRHNTDNVPQGTVSIKNIGLSTFEFAVVRSDVYTTKSYAHWVAFGY